MSEDVIYRNLRPADYDDIIRIWNEAGLFHRPQGRDSREAMTAEMQRVPEMLIGAECDGKLVGTVIGSYDGRRGCVNRLAVLPGYRGRGIAEKLILVCEERLKKNYGATVIFCLIDRENQPSFNLFTKLGYHFHEDILYLSKRDQPES